MIYLKNIREKQTVYIPRTEINGKVVAIKSYDEGFIDGKEEGKKLQKLKLTNLTVTENGVYKREDGWNEVDIDVKPSLQSKTINVTKDVETVMADDAFDGLSKVDVNATQYGRDKRNEGYADGKTDGINEQKSKLESIAITENGIYAKEDGYNSISVNVEGLNGDYDDGYNAGYDDALTNAGETAQVLNITQNGIYTTKYSEPDEANAQVTGYFDDNTPFYGYAHLTNHTIATGITPTKTSKVELWWRPDFNGSGLYQYIFANNSPLFNGFSLKSEGEFFDVKFGNYTKNNVAEVEDKWYHIVVSAEGLVIDGETITTLGTPTLFTAGTGLFINGDGVTLSPVCANGYFGMVKIDGKTLIPTEDGFIDYATNIPLKVYIDGEYDFVEKPTYEGNLIRTIRVNVAGGGSGKINIFDYGMNLKLSTFTEIPEWIDFKGVTNWDYMFGECGQLETLRLIDSSSATTMIQAFNACSSLKTIELIDTSNVVSMDNMFNKCVSLTTIPLLNTSKVHSFNSMFNGCSSLMDIPLIDTSSAEFVSRMFQDCSKLTTIPLLDTSKAYSFDSMFKGCTSLTTIPQIDTSNALFMSNMFDGCVNLTSIPALDASEVMEISNFFGAQELTQLTDFGGLTNLKASMNDDYGFVKTPNLSRLSITNIINKLYNFTLNGQTPSSTEGRLKVHPNFLNSLSSIELMMIKNKGWTITA